MGVNPSGSKPSPTSLLFLSRLSTDPLLTSDARTYLTRNPLLKSCSPPISCSLSIFLPPLSSLSHTLIFCPSRTITPIVRPRWHLRHRLLIALSQPRRHASLTPIGDVSSPHPPPSHIRFLSSTPALPPTQPERPVHCSRGWMEENLAVEQKVLTSHHSVATGINHGKERPPFSTNNTHLTFPRSCPVNAIHHDHHPSIPIHQRQSPLGARASGQARPGHDLRNGIHPASSPLHQHHSARGCC